MASNEGTVVDPLNQIGGQADLENTDVEKIFNEAYAKALPDAPKAAEPIVVPEPVKEEVKPEVAEEKKEEVKTPEVVHPAVVEKPVVAATEEVKTETKTTATQEDPNAWLNSLPEDLRAKAKQVLDERNTFKHQFDSDRQRVIALNKKSMNLERELAALRSQVHKPQDPQLAAQAAQDANKSLAEWEQLIGADPTLAKAIDQRVEARLNAAIGQFDSIAQQRAKQAVAPVQARQEVAARDEEVQLLLKEVPNALDVFESEQYKYWFDTYAAPGIKNVALTSTDHRDALEVLGVYARDLPKVVNDLVAQGKMQAPPQAAPAEQKQAPVAVDTSKADQVAKQREQKLTQAPVVQQAPAAVVPVAQAGAGASIDLDDPGTIALFEQAFQQNLRKR